MASNPTNPHSNLHVSAHFETHYLTGPYVRLQNLIHIKSITILFSWSNVRTEKPKTNHIKLSCCNANIYEFCRTSMCVLVIVWSIEEDKKKRRIICALRDIWNQMALKIMFMCNWIPSAKRVLNASADFDEFFLRRVDFESLIIFPFILCWRGFHFPLICIHLTFFLFAWCLFTDLETKRINTMSHVSAADAILLFGPSIVRVMSIW